MAEASGAPQQPLGQPRDPGESHGRQALGEARSAWREHGRTIVLLVLAVLITVFAVLNRGEVKVNWIFGSSHAPLIVVIVVSLLVGIVITYIAERRVRKRGS